MVKVQTPKFVKNAAAKAAKVFSGKKRDSAVLGDSEVEVDDAQSVASVDSVGLTKGAPVDYDVHKQALAYRKALRQAVLEVEVDHKSYYVAPLEASNLNQGDLVQWKNLLCRFDGVVGNNKALIHNLAEGTHHKPLLKSIKKLVHKPGSPKDDNDA